NVWPDRSRLTARHAAALTFSVFFFADTAPPKLYTLSLHDALPISSSTKARSARSILCAICAASTRRPKSCCSTAAPIRRTAGFRDRKSTRLNSSHVATSYAAFCLKKKLQPAVFSLDERPIDRLTES